MKHSKKILAVLLALVFGASMLAVGAMAAPGGTITLKETSSSVSIDGKVFEAYKLFDVTTDGDEAYAYYFANDDVAAYFAAKTPAITNAAAAVDYIDNLGAEAFAREIYKAMENDELELTPDATATGADGEAVFTGLDAGYYLILDTTVTRSALVLATNDEDLEIELKSDLPTIDKIITNGENGSDKGTFKDEDAVVDFQLSSKVPDMTGYVKYFYIIKDTLNGLTLDENWEDDLAVTIDGVELVNGVDYFVNVSGDEGKQELEIVFADFIQYKDQAGDAIVVTYSAIYTPNAGDYDHMAENEVYVEYSNDPLFDYEGQPDDDPDDPSKPHKPGDDEPKEDSPEDNAKVYSFDLDLTKVDGADNDVTLAGAEFELYKYDEDADDWVLVDTVESLADGKLVYTDLGTGEYMLVETKAPDGYNPLLDPIYFEVTATFDGTEVEELLVDNDAFEADELNFEYVASTIENNSGSILPGTGGKGVYAFYAIGLLLMAGAAVYVIIRRKRETA